MDRYTPTSSHGGMIKCAEGGEWVKWDDVEQLRAAGELMQSRLDQCKDVQQLLDRLLTPPQVKRAGDS